MKKPIFSNEKITTKNHALYVKQRDFIDSHNRKGNIITLHANNELDWWFILALTKDNKIILNKEYKFWPDSFEYNFPWGHLKKWFSDIENIKRELEEETWYTTDNEIIYLWDCFRNGYMSWKNKLFFTKWCYKIWEQNTHEWEEIYNYFIDISDFDQMLENNEILDPYTEICYNRAKKYL